jgi:hypothetical protein
MNLDAGWIMASLVVSGVGFVLMEYGRRMRRVPQAVTGIALMVYPYFVTPVVPMLIIAAVALAVLWFAVRLGW